MIVCVPNFGEIVRRFNKTLRLVGAISNTPTKGKTCACLPILYLKYILNHPNVSGAKHRRIQVKARWFWENVGLLLGESGIGFEQASEHS